MQITESASTDMWPGASIVFSEEAEVLPIRVLECSSRGDKRFSAFNARITLFGREDSIENHYQLSKQFGDVSPTHWKQAKGRNPSHLEINGRFYEAELLTPFYKMLWLIYLDTNPGLVEYAKQFDEFTDMFKGNSINCQADVVRQYINKGRLSIINDCQQLLSEVFSHEWDDSLERCSKCGDKDWFAEQYCQLPFKLNT